MAIALVGRDGMPFQANPAFALTASAVRRRGGALLFAVALVEDVSEQRQLRDEE